MVDTIRRILWLLPLLLAGACGLFWALCRTVTPPAEGAALFFNRAPESVESEAERAVQLTLRGEAAGRARLVELGGAALPHVLASLDGLSVRDQRLVAEALWPIVERMGLWEREIVPLESRGQSQSADKKLIFWREFREEHATDFRPLVVQRLVRRLSSRDLLLRRADLLVVDTYALPTLVEELGRVRSRADAERVERIAELVSHVTGREFAADSDDPIRAARQRATHIRAFWDRHGGSFTSMGRLETMAAMVSQTEFAVWFKSSARQLSRLDDSPLVRRLLESARISVPLFVFWLLGTVILGPALTAWIQVLEMGRYVPLVGRLPVRFGLALGVGTFLPGGLLGAERGTAVAYFSMALAGTLSSAFWLGRDLAERVQWRTHYVLRRRRVFERVRAVVGWLGPSVPTLAPLMVTEGLFWMTCLEIGTGLSGIGARTHQAVFAADLPWLMAAGLSLGLLTGAMQLICDAVLSTSRMAWGRW